MRRLARNELKQVVFGNGVTAVLQLARHLMTENRDSRMLS
jgi:hypothetical protein